MEPLLLITGVLALVALHRGKKEIENVDTSKLRPFQKDFLEAASKVDFGGIPVLFALAHSDLETGGGTGNVFRQTNNLFSITKGSSWKGPVYKAGTGLEFRMYPDLVASIKDWVRLMHTTYYQSALSYALTGDFAGFANELKRLGYDASSKTYASDLIGRYNAALKAVTV